MIYFNASEWLYFVALRKNFLHSVLLGRKILTSLFIVANNSANLKRVGGENLPNIT